MEINFNPGRVPDPGTVLPAARRDAAASADASGRFARTEALERALREPPMVRPEKVQQARVYVGNAKYPPDEMLDRIANLLALHLDRNRY